MQNLPKSRGGGRAETVGSGGSMVRNVQRRVSLLNDKDGARWHILCMVLRFWTLRRTAFDSGVFIMGRGWGAIASNTGKVQRHP